MAVIYCHCSLCPEQFREARAFELVKHIEDYHRLDNELSDSSDSESDQAEPIQVSRRRRVMTETATPLPGGRTTKHTDLDTANPTQLSPKVSASHHDSQPTQPSRKKSSHQEHPELRQPNHKNSGHQERPKLTQPSIKTYFKNQERLNHLPRAAPNNKMPQTPADFTSHPREHGATAANTGSDGNGQRLQDRGTPSALMTSSTPTKKRRRIVDDDDSSASDNPPKRLRPDGLL